MQGSINVILGLTAHDLATDHVIKPVRKLGCTSTYSSAKFSPHLCNSTTMGRVKPGVPACECKNNLQYAHKDYINAVEPSFCEAASTYGMPYGMLCDRLRGTQPRVEAHQSEQIHSVEEEKSILRFGKTLDDLGHSLK